MNTRHRHDTGEYFIGDYRPGRGTGWFDELKMLLGVAVQCFVTTLLIMVVLFSLAVLLEKAALAETTETAVAADSTSPLIAGDCRSIKDCR